MGAIVDRSLTYSDCVRMGAQAFQYLRDTNKKLAAEAFRGACVHLGLPFKSETFLRCRFHRSWGEFAADVEKFEEDKRISTEVERRLELAKGVTTNKPLDPDYEGCWQRLKDSVERRVTQTLDETRRNVVIEVKELNEPVGIIQMGDMHIGSSGVDYDRLDWIASQLARRDIKAFGTAVGDIGDQMIFPKMRGEGRMSPLDHLEELQAIIRYLQKLKDTGHFLGCCAGNHDLFGTKASGVGALDAAMMLIGREIPYAQYELLLDVTIKAPNHAVALGAPGSAVSQTYKFEIRHMVRGHSMWTPQHGVMRHIRFNHLDSDIVVAGHTHRSGFGKVYLAGKMRYGIQTGTYKFVDNYGKELDFADENLNPDYGVILWPNERKIQVMETAEMIETLEGHLLARRARIATGTPAAGTSPRETYSSSTAQDKCRTYSSGVSRCSDAVAASCGAKESQTSVARSGSTKTATNSRRTSKSNTRSTK